MGLVLMVRGLLLALHFCHLYKLHTVFRRRPYRVECTGTLLTSEVKRRRARLVLGWGTTREDLRVLSAFLVFFQHVAGSE